MSFIKWSIIKWYGVNFRFLDEKFKLEIFLGKNLERKTQFHPKFQRNQDTMVYGVICVCPWRVCS